MENSRESKTNFTYSHFLFDHSHLDHPLSEMISDSVLYRDTRLVYRCYIFNNTLDSWCAMFAPRVWDIKDIKRNIKEAKEEKWKNVCLGSQEKDLAENTHSIYIDIRYTINLMLSCIIWFEWSEHRTLHTHATRWCCKCFAIERKRLLTLDG